jgi:hypothetical protein
MKELKAMAQSSKEKKVGLLKDLKNALGSDPGWIKRCSHMEWLFFRLWPPKDAEIIRILTESLTPNDVVYLYSGIPELAIEFVSRGCAPYVDLLEHKLEAFYEIVLDRAIQFRETGIILAKQLDVPVHGWPSPHLEKVATAEWKGLLAIEELAKHLPDHAPIKDGRLLWLMHKTYLETHYLSTILTDTTSRGKKEAHTHDRDIRKYVKALVQGDSIENLEILKEQKEMFQEHPDLKTYISPIEEQALNLAKEDPDYDARLFIPWQKAISIAETSARNSGVFATQWIDESGKGFASEKGKQTSKQRNRQPK